MRSRGLYIQMISLHGKVRSRDVELGCDADTGGQVLYVLELARALAAHPEVARVDLLTRRFSDPDCDPIYAQPIEEIAPGARIVRIPCGPEAYLRKEDLWPHIDEFVRNTRAWVRNSRHYPDLVHGHYADAGLAGARLASDLDIPFVFTGHSLGRVKKTRLLADGADPRDLEARFNFQTRFSAEETALAESAFIVTSTIQEISEQYPSYRNHCPDRMRVIPPGVDLGRFRQQRADDPEPAFAGRLARFLDDPAKPMILAVARPDERKNFRTLLQAFGRDPELRERANLVLIAGCREGVASMRPQERRVMTEILELVDEYDLYGSVAYPKRHQREDVPELYRMAAESGGVFVNPALVEPFGLTLLEAAACGLPVVATRDGGPRDIIRQCRNGLLIDPLDAKGIADALKAVISRPRTWRIRSINGVAGVKTHYSWPRHAAAYVEQVKIAIDRRGAKRRSLEALVRDSGLAGVDSHRENAVSGVFA